jgi:hypothetical protein
MDGLPVVAHRERLEAEHRLQLDQVLAPGLLASHTRPSFRC